jgi:hypothetical protein
MRVVYGSSLTIKAAYSKAIKSRTKDHALKMRDTPVTLISNEGCLWVVSDDQYSNGNFEIITRKRNRYIHRLIFQVLQILVIYKLTVTIKKSYTFEPNE